MADDDDLLSLDFTSYAPSPHVSEPGLVRAQTPVATSKYPLISVPQALLEAAGLYQLSKDIEASRRLEAAIKRNETAAEDAPRIWQALFEVLQALGRKPAFESLALAYARKFGLSPPTWTASEGETCKVAVVAKVTGLPSICLTGALNAQIGDELKQVMKLAQSSSGVSIDLSGATDADNDGATLLIRALKALRNAKKICILNHSLSLAKALNAKLLPGQRENEALWLLQIELYQQAFEKAAFEDAAVGYAVTFEMSPPSYVEAPNEIFSEQEVIQTAEPPVGLSLSGELQEMTVDEFSHLTIATLGTTNDVKSPTVDIDASGLLRIDGSSAAALAQTLEALNVQGCFVRLIGLSQLVAAFLASTAVPQHAELVSRRT